MATRQHTQTTNVPAAPLGALEAKLRRADYLATDEAVASLARDYATGNATVSAVRGSYLRVLCAHARASLGESVGVRRIGRATPEATLEAIERAHTHLYAVVLAAVTTPDIAQDETQPVEERRRRALERNRRSNFARTAKTALTSFVTAGGKLADLKPAEVTKRSLTVPTEPTSLLDKAETSAQRFERLVKRLVKKGGRKDALDLVERVLDTLAPVLEEPKPKRERIPRILSITPEERAANA